MEDVAYLMVWLIGLFVLIGLVMAAVARLVRKDTMSYDRKTIWKDSPWQGEWDKEGSASE
jgi:uncharacterized membrane protein